MLMLPYAYDAMPYAAATPLRAGCRLDTMMLPIILFDVALSSYTRCLPPLLRHYMLLIPRH